MAHVNRSASSSRTSSPPHTPNRSRSSSIMKSLADSPKLQQLHQQQQQQQQNEPHHPQLKKITTNDGLLSRFPSLHSHGHHEDSPMTAQANYQLSDAQLSNKPEHYELKEPIGYGSSAVVYGAMYKPTNRKVAIKVIDLDMFERNQIDELRRETALMALSKHPNVLRVYGSFVSGSKLYIITPYLSGGSCLDIMKTCYPDGFDEISIATILKQALEGLVYLHKNGHIHRDVKAGNLLMDEHGVVQLADFGVSSSLTENNEVRKTFVGTPCWMAPEVMEQAGYDFKADIWSFGITAIELATGHAPFAKYAPMKVLMMTLSQDPPTLSRETAKHKFSKLIKEMIDTCLQKDPKKRPSAEKLLQHPFFRQAKKMDFLAKTILNRIPALDLRPHKKVPQKHITFESTDQWDFDTFSDDDDDDDKKSATSTTPNNKKHISFGDTVVKSANKNKLESTLSPTIESPDQSSSSLSNKQPTSPDLAIPTPQRRSRFVIGENQSDQHNSNTIQSQRSMSSSTFDTHPVSLISTTMFTPSEKTGVGLGISGSNNNNNSTTSQPSIGSSSSASSSSSTPAPPPGQEVKKGRFSVNQTPQRTTYISSPLLENGQQEGVIGAAATTAVLAAAAAAAVTSSTTDHQEFKSIPVTRIGSNDSLRKSRFAVHHSPTMGPEKSTPQEPSSRKSSVGGKISRFSVAKEDSTNGDDSEGRKKGRFQLSGDMKHDSKDGYMESPISSVCSYSPNSSFSRGQRLVDPALIYTQMEHLYRQMESQKVLLQEMLIGLSLQPKSEHRSRSGTLTTEITHTVEHLQHLLMIQGKEKEQLSRENDYLRRELDRLRRSSTKDKASHRDIAPIVVDPLPPSSLDYFTPPRPHTTSPTAMTPLDGEVLKSTSLTVHPRQPDNHSVLPTPSTSYSTMPLP
ncbi:kinase-like domain-containing protein [Chlamydoabsidia padenii]|nr:kinase-like domain-containing protein [Chlamydoabsidia padenii]